MSDFNPVKKDIVLLIDKLPERPREILLLRYGLYGGPALTLNQIGKKYSITRERVRQVQNNSLGQIRDSKDYQVLKRYIDILEKIIASYGKIMAEKHVVPEAKKELSSDNVSNIGDEEIVFLLNLGEKFKESKKTQKFNNFWYLEDGDDQKAKDIVGKFVDEILDKKDPLQKEEMYEALSKIVESEFGLKLENDQIRAILNLSRELKRNCLNLWGHHSWPEITPKNSGDYAYLAMLAEEQPLHFNDIPDVVLKKKINKKKLHAPTVHNVLIKDPRFVLIGKGKYALTRWGYLEGTVSDLIRYYLEKEGGVVEKEDLINRILEQKEVKKSTVLLNINRSPDVVEEDGRIRLIRK